ncbi:hypothetical protein AB7W86_15600 [Providencia rettgeri]
MTDKQINFEAIGHCTHLGARISQLLEHRTELYKELRNLSTAGMIPYDNAMNLKDIDLGGIDKPVELLKKINDINQSIVNAAKTYNSWADKSGYEHYIISGGSNEQELIHGFTLDKTVAEAAIKYTVSGLHSDEYKKDLKQAVKQAIRPVIRRHIKVQRVKDETGIEKFKQQVESEFSQLQAQINGIQCASAASEQSTAQHISGLKRQIATVNESLASLKASIDASAEAVRNTQETISGAIKKAVIEDLAQGGPLCRALR